MTQKKFAQVGIDSPLRTIFDYRIPNNLTKIEVGYRVAVPFGQREVVGIVVGISNQSAIENKRLKNIHALLDDYAIFDKNSFAIIKWASRYYHYPLGASLFTALPPMLRKLKPSIKDVHAWVVLKAENEIALNRAPKQLCIMQWLQQQANPIPTSKLNTQFPNSHASIKALQKHGYIKKITLSDSEHSNKQPSQSIHATQVELSREQQSACEQINNSVKKFGVFLLEGVTGSGKTEVYFNAINKVFMSDDNAQVLILVPEIGLTPQLHRRLRKRFGIDIGLLHSNTGETQRKQTWLNISAGKTRIVLGTRLAVFTPIPHLALIVVDEEHDASLKQQESFLYHARDVAIYRAKQLNIPIVLGSATPSFESLHNAQTNKFTHLHLHKRAHSNALPQINLVDMRAEKSGNILSSALTHAMHQKLQAGQQIILFLNRRGYSPALLCHDCGWVAQCERCDANMTYHSQSNRLICHHCGSTRTKHSNCPKCSSTNLIMLGHGTQRIEKILQNEFSQYSVVRLDRDMARRKGILEETLNDIQQHKYQIIVGTQIISKGHDFPNVSLVGILDIDYGIHSSDFRALERSAQLLIQVAGRSGRRQTQGEVFVQTHTPDHPLLQILVQQGYSSFAIQALKARLEWCLPPYTHHIAIRARSHNQHDLFNFLDKVKALANKLLPDDINIQGPISATMEKKAGQFRAFILLTMKQRGAFTQHIDHCLSHIESLKETQQVRWSVDVDPIDNFA